MKYLRIPCILVFASVVMFSCGPHIAELNIGLLTGKPCSPPCWQNLTPGISTGEEVQQFLRENTDAWSVRDDRISDMGCDINIAVDERESVVKHLVYIFVDQDRLTRIQSDINQAMTLGAIVKRYGEPEYFRATNAVGLDGKGFYTVHIFYPHLGLKLDLDVKFDLDVDEKPMGKILPSMPVDFAEYYPVGDMEDYFFNQHLCWAEPEEIQELIAYEMKFIQPWTGYGEIQVIETR